MDFKEEKLPIYNDTLVFNDLMNRGFYNVLNYYTANVETLVVFYTKFKNYS